MRLSGRPNAGKRMRGDKPHGAVGQVVERMWPDVDPIESGRHHCGGGAAGRTRCQTRQQVIFRHAFSPKSQAASRRNQATVRPPQAGIARAQAGRTRAAKAGPAISGRHSAVRRHSRTRRAVGLVGGGALSPAFLRRRATAQLLRSSMSMRAIITITSPPSPSRWWQLPCCIGQCRTGSIPRTCGGCPYRSRARPGAALGKLGQRRAITMTDRAISTTAALGRGVFGLQLANLAGKLVNALPDRCEGERRCFQPLRRS